jgi:hypothetical protein
VIGRDVRIRRQPSARAPVLATVSFTLVRPIWGPDNQGLWVAVDAGQGRRGYVARRFLRSQGPSAYFNYAGGRWRLAAFITD